MTLPRLNLLHYLAIASLVAIVGLSALLWRGRTGNGAGGRHLVVYCAAVAQKPLERIAAQYEDEYGVTIRLQYGGSATLLGQIEVAQTGDLYLAGDLSHIEKARQKNLADESLPLVFLEPVLAVAKGNPKNIRSVEDMQRPTVRLALGDPDAAEIGRLTKRLLERGNHWQAISHHTTHRGVFKPTEPDLALDVRTGNVDAAIVWRATAARAAELEIVPLPELSRARSLMSVGVLRGGRSAAASLHFARYLAAADRGLEVFRDEGFEPVEGDAWADRPKLTLFAGSVNRRALAPIVERFEQREGVEINTVYNACGFLVAQMRGVKEDEAGFPDIYMACDVYYLEVVNELFQDAVNVSNTDIVICVPKGNPKGIKTLADLIRPGVRVALGEPQNVTIGVLCKRLLEAEGLYQRMVDEGRIAVHTTSSAHLVPSVTTGSVDVALAYRTDTLAEADKLDVITIDLPLAKAVQPFSIARSSKHKYLCRRMLEMVGRSRGDFEQAGFNWQMPGAGR
jgi:molybdenum ABC transporter molybdate-binding protein